MSSTPQDILRWFDIILPQPDQRSLTDDELCLEADILFSTLDEREEQDAGHPSNRAL